ncbi:hypothetical protein [Haloarcula litorea]|uniref:hypothetical protein n=1 Tax=Haloarcula litorea TaxID=3032579 RepID=UPI0023E882E8|nr:hypothetical protein [Halomicroarcula sp. GDY20]
MDAGTTTDDSDVGSALSRLGDSMADLSTSTTGLGDAVEQLRASTQRLSDQQAAVSEQMSETARALDRDSAEPNATVTPGGAAPTPVADD